MKNIRKFNTRSEYNSFIEITIDYPNVCLISDEGEVMYNPYPEPLYVEALENLTVSFSNTYEYSKDCNIWEAGTGDTLISVIAGEKVYFRATDLKTNGHDHGIGTFSIVGGECTVGGNIMSMEYGDNYIGQTTIKKYCQFSSLFRNCDKLIDAKNLILPAKTFNNLYVYAHMFQGCTSLVNAPMLPATSLDGHDYYYMFQGCSSLVAAPDLPSPYISTWSYYHMFEGCKSIVYPPKMETKHVSNYSHSSMFEGCTSLVAAPDLPATYIVESCYSHMFQGCTSLITAPELPATTLAKQCYYQMFSGCTSLTTAPELPATTLAKQCYTAMFSNCTSLVNAPNLPATTLAESCYGSMFKGCTSLTTAPELPATTLKDSCYTGMFSGCTSLTTAPELPATTLAEYCYGDTYNGQNNGMFKGCTSLTTAPDLPATTLSDWCYSGMFYGCTSLTTAPELPATTLAISCYDSMFKSCTSLTTAPELPATTLTEGCYSGMFSGCTSLTSAPELPATTLASYCYGDIYDGLNNGMFRGCTSLTTAPELPATTLANKCYCGMFYRCTSLTTAPELPATTLSQSCYYRMFKGCTSLVNVPNLPATTLVESCYEYMLDGCSNLNYIKMLATDISEPRCLAGWVIDVPRNGTFIKNIEADWVNVGTSGVPKGWDIVYDRTPIECLSISITADDVNAYDTTTMIHYTATVLAQEPDGNIIQTTIYKDVVSDIFPQNTSETETITREISFTYMGVTATTTITQGKWTNCYYIVGLNNQWRLSSTVVNPDPDTYEGVYESFSNKGINDIAAIMYIDIIGYEVFRLYIRSDTKYDDYVIVSQLDQTIDNKTSYNSTLVKAHTNNNHNSGTDISDYDLVEFTNIDGGEHRITIVYKKGSYNYGGVDRGFVLIPKTQ